MAEEKKVEEKKEEKKEEEISKPSEQEEQIVKDANTAATIAKEAEELKAKNLEKEEKLLTRKESINALGGQSPAGTKPETPAELTDTQYAEALERGEVNPLKEDGFIK